jgi:hypothetical protein
MELELNLPSLEERRLHADMVQTFKIVKGIDRVDRRQKAARLEIRRNFFSSRVTDY